jgi:UDP-N-acetylmuramoyl-L-alanyl-D-glutamate--2,6-diaminopimelate ligase
MLTEIKKLIPAVWLAAYHKSLAVLADIIYGRPSEKMVVIGVTGTNGKSSTVSLIAEILEKAGYRVGAASTTLFKLADKEWLNDKKMTMLGRFALQKLLRQMVAAGCRYAVIETSSQGIEQYRHLGIHYDVCVFTNLTPEHIEAHGGFDNYKKAKLKLFKHLADAPVKVIGGRKIAKAIVVNGDDRQAKEFLDFQVDKKIVFGLADGTQLKAENIS